MRQLRRAGLPCVALVGTPHGTACCCTLLASCATPPYHSLNVYSHTHTYIHPNTQCLMVNTLF